jgi:hypothetical protein
MTALRTPERQFFAAPEGGGIAAPLDGEPCGGAASWGASPAGSLGAGSGAEAAPFALIACLAERASEQLFA